MVDLDQRGVGQPVSRLGGDGRQGLVHVGGVAVAVVFHQRGLDQAVFAGPGGDAGKRGLDGLGVALAVVQDDGGSHQGDGPRSAYGERGLVGVPGSAARLLAEHEGLGVGCDQERAPAVGRGDRRDEFVNSPGRVVGSVGGDEPVGNRLHQVGCSSGGCGGNRRVGGVDAVSAVVAVAVYDERLDVGAFAVGKHFGAVRQV